MLGHHHMCSQIQIFTSSYWRREIWHIKVAGITLAHPSSPASTLASCKWSSSAGNATWDMNACVSSQSSPSRTQWPCFSPWTSQDHIYPTQAMQAHHKSKDTITTCQTYACTLYSVQGHHEMDACWAWHQQPWSKDATQHSNASANGVGLMAVVMQCGGGSAHASKIIWEGVEIREFWKMYCYYFGCVGVFLYWRRGSREMALAAWSSCSQAHISKVTIGLNLLTAS